jgi:hypothetical protein
MTSPRTCRRPNQLQQSLLPNRRNLALAATALSKAAASSKLRLRPVLNPLHPTQEDGSSGRLPQRTVNVSPLVLKYDGGGIPATPFQTDRLSTLSPHRVSLHSMGSPISLRTFPLRPALSCHAVFSPRPPPSQQAKLVRELPSKPSYCS